MAQEGHCWWVLGSGYDPFYITQWTTRNVSICLDYASIYLSICLSVNLFIYKFVCLIYIYICMYVCMHTYIYIYIYVYVYIYIYLYACVYIYICMYVYVYMYICKYTWTFLRYTKKCSETKNAHFQKKCYKLQTLKKCSFGCFILSGTPTCSNSRIHKDSCIHWHNHATLRITLLRLSATNIIRRCCK